MDPWPIAHASLIAMLAAIVPRVLSGPAERPIVLSSLASESEIDKHVVSPALAMGCQVASGALVVAI